MQIIFDDNTNTITLTGVQDVDGVAINDATVVLTALRDSAGSSVAGSTNISMANVATGSYRCKVPATLALSPGQHYTAIIDADKGGDKGHWEEPLVCKTRTN